MAWIESHQTLGDHPKTKKLARLLSICLPQAVGHLQYLWWWALDYREDGDLTGLEAFEIADAARWEGDARLFMGTLEIVGFLDINEEQILIHDWWDYAGRLVLQRRASAARMRKLRAANVTRTFGEVCQTCVATVPNRTIPNHVHVHCDAHAAPNGAESVLSNSAKKNLSKPPKIDYPVEFEAFWNDYPKKEAKADAYKAYIKALKSGLVDESTLLIAAKYYRETCQMRNTDDQYIARPASFLKRELWDAYKEPPKPMRQNSNRSGIVEEGPHYEAYDRQKHGI